MSKSLKELSRLLKESRLKITNLNAQAKTEGLVRDDFENRLVAAMDAAGTVVVKNEHGTFGRKEALMPKPTDWELVYKYVKDNDMFDLLYKAISPTVFRELTEAGEEIPGMDTYNKVSISVHKPSV